MEKSIRAEIKKVCAENVLKRGYQKRWKMTNKFEWDNDWEEDEDDDDEWDD